MKQSLAKLLDDQLPFLTENWSLLDGDSAAPLENALARPDGPLYYTHLREAVRTEDRAEWLAWMRRAGAARADAGGDVSALIAEALCCLNRVRVAVLGELSPQADEGRGVACELDKLETEIVTALVSGYFDGQERRADEQRIAFEEQERRSAEQRMALEELSALFKINSAANSTLDFNKVLDEVVAHVAEAMGTDVCSLFIYEPELGQLVLRATRGLAPEMVGRVRLQLGEGVTGWAARQGSPLALPDGWQDDRFLYVPGIGEERTKAILAVPIILYTKLKLVGVITLQSYGTRHFTDRDIRFLETVAGEVAIAIENARLHSETDIRLAQKVEQLKILQGISAGIAATLNLAEVLRLIVTEAVHLMRADAALLYEFREGGLVPIASLGLQPGETPVTHTPGSFVGGDGAQLATLNPETDLIARAVLAGKPVVLDSRGGYSGDIGLPIHSIGADVELYLSGFGFDQALPLHVTGNPDGLPYASRVHAIMLAPRSIVGSICVFSREPRSFDEEQVRLLLAFGREGAIAIENAHLYEEARRSAEVQSLLLREMHHRVRNNLQRTASLLRMQAHRLSEDSVARHALQESVIRIQSIARVHDLLSRGEVGLTEVGAVANLACEVVNNTLGRPDLRVRWQVEAEPLLLSSHEAFPLTLLLTELLSNSVLHGFAGREEGQVHIRATHVGNEVMLVIRDNGQGLPEGFDSVTNANLGLEVVRRLGEQELDGRVTIEPNPEGQGTQAIIRFPYTPNVGAPSEADFALVSSNGMAEV